jgi:hypothetical protein
MRGRSPGPALCFCGNAATDRAICSGDRRFTGQCCPGNGAWFCGLFSFGPHDRQHGRGKCQLSEACCWRADRLHIAGRDAHLDGRRRPHCDLDRRRRNQSELGPNATDIERRCGEERSEGNARFIPERLRLRKPNAHFHSITPSAPASSIFGMTIPRAFAVPILMTSSNFVGACTGRSAGLAPRRRRLTYSDARRN